jgi:hypothetical protein
MFEDFSKSVNITYLTNQIIEWVQEDKKQITLRVHQIDQVNSLTVMKMLEAL